MAGVVCTPLFHCPRCRDHWIEFGTVPEDCQFKRQPTRGPAIHMAKGRKPRKDFRKKKTKRRLGFVDAVSSLLENFISTSMTGQSSLATDLLYCLEFVEIKFKDLKSPNAKGWP